MRFLKVVAQDRSGNGVADTVTLHFHEDSDTPLFEAIAVDTSADGLIEFSRSGDVNNDGKLDFWDQLDVKTFAEAYLRLNWCNKGNDQDRHLIIDATDHDADGSVNVITLRLNNGDCSSRQCIQIQWQANYGAESNTSPDSFTLGDLEADTLIDAWDQPLLHTLANAFLAFRWTHTSPPDRHNT